MKKRLKYIISILFLVILVSVIIIVYIAHENKKKDMQPICVEGLIASYEYIDRDISLEYFYKLDNTSTYNQIVEDIGIPNGYRGSGLILPYYEVDKLYVVISFRNYTTVGEIFLCSNKERLDQIYPR